jgi:parvulin-like peptidyl-prolyl isomerase
VKIARGGTDFGKLAREYSSDASKVNGGDIGAKTPTSFGKPLDEAILHLAAGEISEPLFANGRLYIVKVTERAPSTLPKYSDVKDVVMSRVHEEMLQKQIKVWLDELKTGVYIDIRL